MCEACGCRMECANAGLERRKQACVPVNSCRPYGGQLVRVFWRKLEVLR